MEKKDKKIPGIWYYKGNNFLQQYIVNKQKIYMEDRPFCLGNYAEY